MPARQVAKLLLLRHGNQTTQDVLVGQCNEADWEMCRANVALGQRDKPEQN
jgi:hypothetical protein